MCIRDRYDDAVTEKALELIQKDQYDLIVVYNQEYDDMIHRTQPESPEAMAAFHHHIDAFDRLTKCVKANWADHDTMAVSYTHLYRSRYNGFMKREFPFWRLLK